MTKRLPYWLALVLLGCVFAFTVKQDTAGKSKRQTFLTLLVTVYDQYGNRIENAYVHLAHPWTSRSWTLKTNNRGRAFMPLDNNTQYSAVAEKTGFLHSTTRIFQTQSKTRIDTLPLILILQ
jgi:hypothetical protein